MAAEAVGEWCCNTTPLATEVLVGRPTEGGGAGPPCGMGVMGGDRVRVRFISAACKLHQTAAMHPALLLLLPPTWRVDDREVGAELVLNLDHDLLGPELLLSLQPGVLDLDVLLRGAAKQQQRVTASCEVTLQPRLQPWPPAGCKHGSTAAESRCKCSHINRHQQAPPAAAPPPPTRSSSRLSSCSPLSSLSR